MADTGLEVDVILFRILVGIAVCGYMKCCWIGDLRDGSSSQCGIRDYPRFVICGVPVV